MLTMCQNTGNENVHDMQFSVDAIGGSVFTTAAAQVPELKDTTKRGGEL